MSETKLTKDEIKQKMKKVSEWVHQLPDIPEDSDMLFKMYPFEGFKEAKQFVDKVANIAISLEHYPVINFTTEYVNIMLWTADLNGLSEKDFELAEKIDGLNQPAMVKENFIPKEQ